MKPLFGIMFSNEDTITIKTNIDAFEMFNMIVFFIKETYILCKRMEIRVQSCTQFDNYLQNILVTEYHTMLLFKLNAFTDIEYTTL